MDLVTYGGPDSRCGEWVGNRDGVLGTPALIRSIARGIVKPCRVPEQCVNSTSAQYQSNGRRAGLKIRSSQEGVGSSPTFGTKTTSPPNPRKVQAPG